MLENLFQEFKGHVHSGSRIIEEATNKVLTTERLSPEEIKARFSRLITDINEEAYNLYKNSEAEAGEKVILGFLQRNQPRGVFPTLNVFFRSLNQSRRSRAGSAFEETIRTLFKKCEYPFQEQCVINGKPDFLMPSEAYYRRNAPGCIIFTAKRTLRERWRQIVTEGIRGWGFFLATLDNKVPESQLLEMLNNRIYLVVPIENKEKNNAYKNADNVLSFERFFIDHLDPAMARWKRDEVI